MTDSIIRLNAALEGRYQVEREIGEGGMAVDDVMPYIEGATLRDKMSREKQLAVEETNGGNHRKGLRHRSGRGLAFPEHER